MKPGVLKRLERFNKALEILEELKTKKKEVFVNDLWLVSVAERNIQIAAEFAVDIGNALLAGLGEDISDTYKETVSKLARLGIIDNEKEMKEIVGMRNLLVHLYADVKYDLIFDSLDEIVSNLKKFVDKILIVMKEKGIDP